MSIQGYYKGTIPIIDPDTPIGRDWLYPKGASYGAVPRDYSVDPISMFDPPSQMKIYSESEWDALYDEQEEQESSLEHIFLRGGKPAFVNLDQNGNGYCLPPGTQIKMADGSYKSIEQLRLLDEVVSAEGNVRKVAQLHSREYSGELVNLKLHGHGHLRLTPNHSVLTKRGYIPSGELKQDDYVSLPKYSPTTCKVLITSSHVKEGAKRKVRIINKEGEGSFTKKEQSEVPMVLELTYGLGRILGLYLAEGSLEATRVTFSFGTTKKKALYDELKTRLESELGITSRLQKGPVDSVTLIRFSGEDWVQLIESLCGKLAHGKFIHPDLMSGPKEFLEGLFWGWMDADGCRRTPNKTRGYTDSYRIGTTVSKRLALCLFDIANVLGLEPVLRKENAQKNKYAASRKDPWKIVVKQSGGKKSNFRVVSDSGNMWRKVRSVEKTQYQGMVFNIGVEVDNTYIAEGIGVHNCWAYSTGHAIMLARLLMNQPLRRLNPHSVAAIIKGGADEGGWCGLSAEFARRNGYAEEGTGPGQWPLHSRNLKYDTPECRAEMAKFKSTEEWVDLNRPVYDVDMSMLAYSTALFNCMPSPSDFNFWSHSVCAIRRVRISRGNWGTLILNSWLGWGRFGLGVLEGSKAKPDSMLSIRVARAA